MGFTALRLGCKHWEREKRFLKWELDFSPFTILFDTIAQMCLFELKEIKFCTSRHIGSCQSYLLPSRPMPRRKSVSWSGLFSGLLSRECHVHVCE